MKNMVTEVVDGHLIIKIDVSERAVKAAPMSSTGKNKLLATSEGHVAIPGTDGLKIGLNLTHPA